MALFSTLSAAAWGKRGHDIIARIAYHYLTDADKAALKPYLGNLSIEAAANWMDDVKTSPAYSLTASWHDVLFAKGTSFQPGKGTNAVNAITYAIDEMQGNASISMGRKQYDLFVIMHLAGDLHQPLHTGYDEDNGGRDYKVSFLGKPATLHSVWDSSLIAAQDITYEDCLNMAETLHKDDRSASIHITDWLYDTRALTESTYPANRQIDQVYLTEMTPTVEKQLALAGIRLAALLHRLLQGGEPLTPLAKTPAPPASTPANRTETPAVKSASAAAANSIPLDRLTAYAGKQVRTCGQVFRVRYLTTFANTPTYINIGAPYPESPLTLILWQNVRDNLSYVPEEKLDGKTICVTGTITLYKGKAQMVVHKESDIQIQ